MAKELIIKCKCGSDILEEIDDHLYCVNKCGNIYHEILTKIYNNGFKKGEISKVEEIKSCLDIREEDTNGY